MSLVTVSKVELASDILWGEVENHCSYATFFHTREWAEIWNRYTGGLLEPDCRVLTFSDGKQAIFPLCRRKTLKGVMSQYLSSPEWTYGGWLSLDSLTPEHHKAIWEYFGNYNLMYRQNPFDVSLTESNLPWTDTDFTQVIDLRQGLAALKESWNGAMARKVKKATRAGVEVVEATTLEEWQEYFKAYQSSQERWADVIGESYSWSLFEELHRRQSPKIKLWLAKIGENVVSGALCFYHNRHTVYWHGASYEEYFNLRPANLLHTRIIEKACEDGYWWYDFNPSAGLNGVAQFKASFGAKELPANKLVNKQLSRKIIDQLKLVVPTGQSFVRRMRESLQH